nr:hypothetical protein [Tanacetum cinerariifolium]
MTAAVTGVANVVVEAPRPKRDEEFTAEENARDLADIQAARILSQGLPYNTPCFWVIDVVNKFT